MSAASTATIESAIPSAWRQMVALIRMELLLLRRNMTATVMSVLTPLLVSVLLISGVEATAEDAVAETCGLIGFLAVFCVHHHLATAYASRRQEMVLKRLRTALPSDRTVLIGVASASLIVFVVQAVVLIGYGVLVLDMPVPANPLTMLSAMLLGGAVLAGFAAALSAITHSSEAAMLTTLPTVAIFVMAPGVLTPLGTLPETLENVAMFQPMGPFMKVLRTGWLGHEIGEPNLSFVGSIVDGLPWLTLLAVWLIVAGAVTKRYFRWEPRHSS